MQTLGGGALWDLFGIHFGMAQRQRKRRMKAAVREITEKFPITEYVGHIDK